MFFHHLHYFFGVFATINGAAFGADNTFFLTNDLGSFEYKLSYLGGDGNDLVISAVPEPAAGLLCVGGLAGLWMMRRRIFPRPHRWMPAGRALM